MLSLSASVGRRRSAGDVDLIRRTGMDQATRWRVRRRSASRWDHLPRRRRNRYARGPSRHSRCHGIEVADADARAEVRRWRLVAPKRRPTGAAVATTTAPGCGRPVFVIRRSPSWRGTLPRGPWRSVARGRRYLARPRRATVHPGHQFGTVPTPPYA
jgi:hypothetical protein